MLAIGHIWNIACTTRSTPCLLFIYYRGLSVCNASTLEVLHELLHCNCVAVFSALRGPLARGRTLRFECRLGVEVREATVTPCGGLNDWHAVAVVVQLLRGLLGYSGLGTLDNLGVLQSWMITLGLHLLLLLELLLILQLLKLRLDELLVLKSKLACVKPRDTRLISRVRYILGAWLRWLLGPAQNAWASSTLIWRWGPVHYLLTQHGRAISLNNLWLVLGVLDNLFVGLLCYDRTIGLQGANGGWLLNEFLTVTGWLLFGARVLHTSAWS